ncbi:glycosyltransferase family 2 protein [Ectothiorhodospira mobilis]|uniref:glycosyltransferase family 2 protein n=1 Tax=Ectothiorhodospira mobilis TaxID=195064 RepID=UPI0019087AEF|nr:glycosyltransferase family 2 protein [Ectothiorhodospira mobilis]MBK1692971.1 hypothetical protein [Ectothiorhodospira mobilis]
MMQGECNKEKEQRSGNTISKADHHSTTLSIIIPVVNNASQAAATIQALAAEAIPDPIEIILVDDGSDSPIQIDFEATENLKFIPVRLKKNQGRAGALNAGIDAASGLYMTFLDVDCMPTPSYVENLRHAISIGAPIIFGDIQFDSGDSFFDRYGNRVQARRRSRIDQWAISLTSANVTIHRNLVLAINGFDPDYRHYGFEDRDFFLRLSHAFPDVLPVYDASCSVRHVDPIHLEDILAKFERSGCHTAGLFRTKHPDAYREMPMYYFDAQANPVYRHIPDWLLVTVIQGLGTALRLLFITGYKLGWHWVAAPALKGLNGLAFMRGTLSANRDMKV